jgi:hypothetical protein
MSPIRPLNDGRATQSASKACAKLSASATATKYLRPHTHPGGHDSNRQEIRALKTVEQTTQSILFVFGMQRYQISNTVGENAFVERDSFSIRAG